MQIVMFYVAGDGCSWSSDITHPIEYAGLEEALVDFETAAKIARAKKQPFKFAGFEFDPSHFFFNDGQFFPPHFMTVDEWFKLHGAQS